MKLSKRLLTTVLTLALGLGVWSMAVSFTSSGFGAGDTLSATQLNDLLNDNFDAAETAIGNLENAVDGKLDKSGGTMSGALKLEATSSDATLYLKNRGSGPILQALGQSGFGASITNAGDIELGAFSGSSGVASIRLEAQTGDIMLDGTIRTNDDRARSLLPVAVGVVTSNVFSGRSSANVLSMTRPNIGQYDVTFAAGTVPQGTYPLVVANAYSSSTSGTALTVTVDPTPLGPSSNPTGLRFFVRNNDGTPVNPAGLSFLLYAP